MSELKPSAWSLEYNGTHVTADKSLAMSLKADGVPVTPLYAIPEGYALVKLSEATPVPNDALNYIYGVGPLDGEWMCDTKEKTGMPFAWRSRLREAIMAYNAEHKDAQFPKGSVVDEEV